MSTEPLELPGVTLTLVQQILPPSPVDHVVKSPPFYSEQNFTPFTVVLTTITSVDEDEVTS